jgi:U2 small nuclear ribonucleoprotein A'
LIICNNRISKISDISTTLPNIENLVLTNNKLADLEDIDILGSCQNLQRLVLINNQITNVDIV